MPIAIQEPANEGSTFGIPIAFADDVGAAVIPNAGTLTWTLTDLAGNVVNSRSAVPITPATTVTIVLHGADLALGGVLQGTVRVVTVQCLYNSSLGTNLEWTEEFHFEIAPLLMVT